MNTKKSTRFPPKLRKRAVRSLVKEPLRHSLRAALARMMQSFLNVSA